MDDQSIINKRISEVRAESEILQARLDDNSAELAELEAAARVIARLKGSVSHPAANAVVESKDQAAPKTPKPDGLPTMPELILMALRQTSHPLEPREIAEVIRRNWWPDVDGKKIGSIVWRLNNRDDIQKVEGTSTYRLPQKDEASDENPGRNTSEASLFTADPEAQGVKAAPGGGP